MERMASILSQIKDRFNGEVYVGENIIWNDSRVFNEVDGIVVSLPNLLFDDEVAGATVELLEERVAEYTTQLFNTWSCNTQQPCWEYTTYEIPKVIWNMFAQSHALFLSKGWVEDGFCTQGTYDDVYYDECMQYAVPTNFSTQAIFIEGMLRAIDKQPWFETKGTTASTAYWLSDLLFDNIWFWIYRCLCSLSINAAQALVSINGSIFFVFTCIPIFNYFFCWLTSH